MTTKNLGSEGFRWFVGVVEDREDPDKLGRVRVRAHAFHGNNVEAPTSTLPWAIILMPGYSSSLKEVGTSSTGLQVGSTVVGFFFDGDEGTMPIIFGVLPGKDDIAKLAIGQNTINKEMIGTEPESAYNATYPYNKVFKSESGHVVEIDDTPNYERLHTFHKSGTYTEIDHDGRHVLKVVGDSHEVVAKNKKVFILGDLDIEVTGDIRINGKTINLNRGNMGAARIGDTADTGDDGSGGHFDTNAAGTNVIETGSGTVFIGD